METKIFTKPVNKHDRLKKFILILVQALCCGMIGFGIFAFRLSATVTIENLSTLENYVPSFSELSSNYYNSDSFVRNMLLNVEQVVRYTVIQEQLEDNNVFNGKKKISVAKFANRNNEKEYTGPDAEYYLDDLIKWAQRGVSRDYKIFWSEESYLQFFQGIDTTEEDYINNQESGASPYFSFATIINRYKTVDGKNLEECVTSSEEYNALAVCLSSTISDLYSNYREYQLYNDKYAKDATNIRYYSSMTIDGKKCIFTNVDELRNVLSESTVSDTFKVYGKYIYFLPGKLDYLCNMPISYDEVKNIMFGNYSYAFPDDTCFWIAIDTNLNANDVFKSNYIAFERTTKLIPWIVSLCAISLILFVSLFVYVISFEKKRIAAANLSEEKTDLDHLPIEVSILFFILLIMILFYGERLLFNNLLRHFNAEVLTFIPPALFVSFDIFVLLYFFYGLVRRIVSKTVFSGSLISLLTPGIKRHFSRFSAWFWKVYDSSDVAIRTWVSYVFFMIFNVFWALMLFFSNYTIISLIVLAVFDITVGVILFNRNYERKQIADGILTINKGDYEFKIDVRKMHGENKDLADAVNDIGNGIQQAVEISTKDEKMKADLITNVSHDIKTPLTSIINYVDLLKREKIEDERVKKYINILDEKSQRLKQLTYDLLEASRITSGNITIDYIKLNYIELMEQSIGEFEEKFNEKGLTVVTNFPDKPVYVMADPRHTWRIIENIFNNVYKYALQDTRVYLDLIVTPSENGQDMVMSLKNISGQQLNIAADELTERFIRGDVSRSTEGSGLGLSIAKSLTTAQHGNFNIYLDGDLFKVTITFPVASE